jgi:hypothetical protein
LGTFTFTQSLEWVAFRIQNWIFFIKSILEWENSFSFGGKKNRMKKCICSKRNKIRMGKCIESGGGELHTRLEISKGRGWWKRLLQ